MDVAIAAVEVSQRRQERRENECVLERGALGSPEKPAEMGAKVCWGWVRGGDGGGEAHRREREVCWKEGGTRERVVLGEGNAEEEQVRKG